MTQWWVYTYSLSLRIFSHINYHQILGRVFSAISRSPHLFLGLAFSFLISCGNKETEPSKLLPLLVQVHFRHFQSKKCLWIGRQSLCPFVIVMMAKGMKTYSSPWFIGRTSPQEPHFWPRHLFAKHLLLPPIPYWLLGLKPRKDRLVWGLLGLSEEPQHQRL